MIYNERLLEKLVDKHLEKYNTSLSAIRKEEVDLAKNSKNKKKVEPYFLKYPFLSEREDLEWQKWAKKEVGKFYKDWSEERLDQEWTFIDAMMAPSCMYLFKEIPKTLFN